MGNNELISVIVPLYNSSATLDKCIRSIVDQMYKNIEIILVDDGSTDDSLKICNHYKEIDERIIVMHQENSGPSCARNLGLKLAKGKFFCFVDSDDFIEPQMILKLYESLKQSNSELAICGYNYITKKNNIPRTIPNSHIRGQRDIAQFIASHYTGWVTNTVWGKLYKKIKHLTIEFDKEITMGEDLMFNIQYIKCIDGIDVIDECLYNYVDTENSFSKIYRAEHYKCIRDICLESEKYIIDVLGVNYVECLQKIYLKLFSCTVSFMAMHISLCTKKEEKEFIKDICSSDIVQRAATNLNPLSFVYEIYRRCIIKKNIFFLYFLSLIKIHISKAKNK